MELNFTKQNKNILEVDFSTLEMTRDYESLGKDRSHPIHYRAIAEFMSIITNGVKGSNYQPDMSKLWISSNGGLQLKNTENPLHPSNFLIERTYCRVDLNNIEDKSMNMAIGILFNERGYNIAFGINVRECTNFTVFGDHFFSTYGSYKKADHKALLEVIARWVSTLELRRKWYYNLYQELSEKHFSPQYMKEVIGDMTIKAIAANHGNKTSIGLNQTLTAKYALEYFEKYLSKEKHTYITAWDALNIGTNLLKPTTSDLADLQADIECFNNSFLKTYCGITEEAFETVDVEHEEIPALDGN